ncbi:hypothetical protein F5Y18DRAFT_437314 [Xylariaceae sp. FL1019]|nr:hypothetical protein F5Y18DRAFT_437314 [Xylariaceae sp. FL1019]
MSPSDPVAPVDTGIGSTIDPASLGLSRRLWITVFEALAIYNSIELILLILCTFKRRHGLYFWSLMVATWGIIINSIAFILNNNRLLPIRMVPVVFITLGWNCMITGQSLVLYSRLHLLFSHESKLRLVLAMIIATAVLVYIPSWIVTINANVGLPAPHQWLVAYSLFERIQIIVFSFQETTLSTLYLVKCYRFWTAESLRTSPKIRGMIIHLVVVNLITIAFDISLIYCEWDGQFLVQTSYKAFIYSVKLKLEISILTRLAKLVKVARDLQFEENMSRQLEQEWTNTLESTIGPGHKGGTPGGGSDAALVSIPEGSDHIDISPPERMFTRASSNAVEGHIRTPSGKSSISLQSGTVTFPPGMKNI